MRAEIMGRWVMRAALLVALACGAGCYEAADEVGGESHFLRPCERQAQCEDLGSEFSCVAGFCRGPAGDSAAAPADDGPLAATTPLALLLVDTSGSLEWTAGCTCETTDCEECLPDYTRGGRNRFTNVLEALTGTFDDFACETIDRSDPDEDPDNDSYDTGYYLPYHRPSGEQRADGLLDEYRDRLRFGLATFDGWDTWRGAAPLVAKEEFDFGLSANELGLWSYNPVRDIPDFDAEGASTPGEFRYPNTAGISYMDTGIRNASAESGALMLATDPARAGRTNDAIQRSLLAVRPYGGTPIASSLDDLYYLIAQGSLMASERDRGTPIHVVLITDGYPDDDYRSFGCDCGAESDNPDRCGLGPMNDPSTMFCPYPTPEQAAYDLRCGRSGTCRGPVEQVHVIAFAVDDPAAVTRLDAIAIEGGGQGARLAPDVLSLRRELNDVLTSIAER